MEKPKAIVDREICLACGGCISVCSQDAITMIAEKALVEKISNKFGIKIKSVNIDAKFFIVDRKEILFYLSKSPNQEDLAIWLNSSFFSEAFASLFEMALK